MYILHNVHNIIKHGKTTIVNVKGLLISNYTNKGGTK